MCVCVCVCVCVRARARARVCESRTVAHVHHRLRSVVENVEVRWMFDLSACLSRCRAPVLVAIALIESGLEPLDAINLIRAKRTVPLEACTLCQRSLLCRPSPTPAPINPLRSFSCAYLLSGSCRIAARAGRLHTGRDQCCSAQVFARVQTAKEEVQHHVNRSRFCVNHPNVAPLTLTTTVRVVCQPECRMPSVGC